MHQEPLTLDSAGYWLPAPTHRKRPKQQFGDRDQLVRAALLWRSQQIYLAARRKFDAVCDQHPWVSDDRDDSNNTARREAAEKVLYELTDTIGRLGGHLDRSSLEDSGSDQGTRSNQKASGPNRGCNCTTNEDCPEDYICEENQCVYLFSEV